MLPSIGIVEEIQRGRVIQMIDIVERNNVFMILFLLITSFLNCEAVIDVFSRQAFIDANLLS